jgi:hypothetical protein
MNINQLLTIILMTTLHLVVANGESLRGFNREVQEDLSYRVDAALDAKEDHRRLKWNAAQKRQSNRDKRREKTNPFRTQGEENAERWRKHQQAINRGNSRVDPYEPKHGGRQFMRARNNGRNYRKNDMWNPHWWSD